jgi:hypothetical protein
MRQPDRIADVLKRSCAAIAISAAILAAPVAALGQGAPTNSDLGAILSTTVGPVGTGTVNSPTQTNNVYKGVNCTAINSSSSGSPTATWTIQEYDAASNSFLSLFTPVTFPNVAFNVPSKMQVYPGIQTTSLPSNVTALNYHLARFWRVQLAVTGAQASVTSQVSCVQLP